ncbi:hypothetical protein [Mesorhizobium sp. CN2-181]|uniref:hypothetical protein n=1 Tax=Mesorhizobium yinganensis TaxID=3157707 RepID=UPI0032B70BED
MSIVNIAEPDEPANFYKDTERIALLILAVPMHPLSRRRIAAMRTGAAQRNNTVVQGYCEFCAIFDKMRPLLRASLLISPANCARSNAIPFPAHISYSGHFMQYRQSRGLSGDHFSGLAFY